MSSEIAAMDRAKRRLPVAGHDLVLDEVATGRFYFGGEPEVRMRGSVEPDHSTHLLVITIMGDGDEPVGLTASLFQAPSGLSQGSLESVAKADIVSRVEMSRGKVLRQDGRKVEAPRDLRTFMVVEMLRSAHQFLE